MRCTIVHGFVVALAVLAAFFTPKSTHAQEPSGQRLRVFLDCSGCEPDYVRTEIDWVDYVRDREDSDVHILVTTRTTGPGGREYTFNFIGRGAFEAKSDTITWISSLDDTSDIRRQGVVRVLKMGLMRYVAESPLSDRIRISLAPPAAGPTGPQEPTDDPWNYWVFSTSANGFLNGESQQQSISSGLSISANRTTDAWKIRFTGRNSYSESKFDVDSVTTITSIRRSYTGSMLVAKSMGPRLSSGLSGEVESSTFGNIEFAWRLAPAIEYNVFPYAESTRREFILQYSVGINSFDYREETIYGETTESRPAHALAVHYSVRQPWGSTDVGLSGSQFLHDTSKYSWSVSGGASVRLFRGLSVNANATYSRVRDQLAVPAGDATRDEILLRQRLLQTNYFYFVNFGLSYRFGSIFNTVVNPRFGNGVGGGSFVVF
jgi:hypothetical protein